MKTLIILFLLICFTMVNTSFAKDTEPVQSTEGIEIDQNIAKSKTTTEQKNEQKQIKNRSKEYINMKRKTQKQDYKRTIKQKELEYMEQRLEVKKQKLELLDSDNTLKGEKE